MVKSTEAVLSAAYEFIVSQSRPVHYKSELFPAMVKQGWISNNYDGEAWLYNQIYGDMRRNGENSRFMRSGRGNIFAREEFDPEKHNAPKFNVTESNPQAKDLSPKAIPQVCGTCKHISFTGIKEVTWDSGTCERYEDSGRLTVRPLDDRCPLWLRRSTVETETLALRRWELRILVDAVNGCAQRGVTWKSLEEFHKSLDEQKKKKRTRAG